MLEEALASSVDGVGKEERSGPPTSKEESAVHEATADTSRTGGTCSAEVKANRKAGLLDANSSVMKATVARPRLYSASLIVGVMAGVEVGTTTPTRSVVPFKAFISTASSVDGSDTS